MMLDRHRAIRGENHTGEYLGDAPTSGRVEYEDSLIQAIEDVILSGRIEYFRDWLKRWARDVGWNETDYQYCLHNEYHAWLSVWHIGCSLRRLMPYYQYCANQLLQYGHQPGEGLSSVGF